MFIITDGRAGRFQLMELLENAVARNRLTRLKNSDVSLATGWRCWEDTFYFPDQYSSSIHHFSLLRMCFFSTL